jgi:uncharacterized tellurite resistance protein B-like protein
MIKNIQKYFERHIGSSRDHAVSDPQHRLRLAAAALLIETARVDYAEDPQELEQIRSLLQSHFGLGAEQTEELLTLAEAEADQMTSYYQFTSTINRECDIQDKAQILKLMWQIAYADGRIDKFEQHMLSKIASLLYIPREQMVAARRAAEKESGIES